MTSIEKIFTRLPLISAVLVVLLGIALAHLLPAIIAAMLPGVEREQLSIFTRLAVGGGILGLLIKLNWQAWSGINRQIKWHSHWVWAGLPICLVAAFNLFFVHWSLLVFDAPGVFFILIDNLATGVFEEMTLRGLAFVILWRAWHHKPYGIVKAAFGQAMIFGMIHLINLSHGFTVDVIAQVIYANLLGVSFAGLLVFTRSIVPCILAHMLINIVGNLNRTFNPDYVPVPQSIEAYAMLIGLIVLFIFPVGLWQLLNGQKASFEAQPAH
jgi:hypothetical protein